MRRELDEATWRPRQRAHEARTDAWIRPHLSRRRRGVAHPVDDFLFTYYSHRPAALRRWHPGIGVALTGSAVGAFSAVKGYVVEAGRAYADPTPTVERLDAVRWIRDLLRSTADRPAVLGCFGLHEWAMVYRQPPDERRHASYPLRLGARGTDDVVESHRVTCTHHDAFRFFTAAARPLNVVQPTRREQARHEQPGCLHATMDLYKWAYKLAPYTSSELVADCFALARAVRQVDMRASPYDLSGLGIEPLRIETAEGKAAYLTAQQDFAARGAPLRSRLVEVCNDILSTPASAASALPTPLSRRGVTQVPPRRH